MGTAATLLQYLSSQCLSVAPHSSLDHEHSLKPRQMCKLSSRLKWKLATIGFQLNRFSALQRAELFSVDGTAIRDYVHAWDLARAHVLALEHLLDRGDSIAVNLASWQGSIGSGGPRHCARSRGAMCAVHRAGTAIRRSESPIPRW